MDEYEPEYEPEDVTLRCSTLNSTITIAVMTVLPPPVEYMSMLHDQHVEISSRKVWCGSLLLGEHLLALPPRPATRCLELGAGTGIVGLTLAKANFAKLVVLSDGDDEAITLLAENATMNEIDVKECSADKTTLGLVGYLWGDDAARNKALSDWCRARWPAEEWGEASGTAKFGLIVAGDVMYKEELPDLFFASAKELLEDDGELFLCHVPRANVTQEVVVAAAERLDFVVERVDKFDFRGERGEATTLPDGCPMDDAERACIYRITKN
jgi:predicted nicotinamide N-methyase